MLIVAVAVGTPALFGFVPPRIPRASWAALFVVLIVSLFVAAVGERLTRTRYAAFGVAVVASWAVVATASATGLLPILLVLTAALSAYVVPVRVGVVLIGLNSVVLAGTTVMFDADRVDIVMTVGFYALIQWATLFSSMSLLREQRMRRELTETHVELQAATVLLAESARTAERLRISRELHDLVGHQLTVLALELEAARHRDGDSARAHVEHANTVARGMLADVRATVGELRSESTDLAGSLRQLVDGLPGLDVTLDVAPDAQVGDEHTVAFVRALQEIVTNTVRHTDARRLHVEVITDEHGTTLTAIDDGPGARNVTFGNGLRGLAERFDALGGTVTVDGRDGFRVTVRVPAP